MPDANNPAGYMGMEGSLTCAHTISNRYDDRRQYAGRGHPSDSINFPTRTHRHDELRRPNKHIGDMDDSFRLCHRMCVTFAWMCSICNIHWQAAAWSGIVRHNGRTHVETQSTLHPNRITAGQQIQIYPIDTSNARYEHAIRMAIASQQTYI